MSKNSNLQHKLRIFGTVILSTKCRPQIPQKLVYEKFYVHEKILGTQNCRGRFIKNLVPEKRKENM